MADKPPEEGYISVVDEEPEIFELLKWDTSQTQKRFEIRNLEKAKSPETEKRVPKPREDSDPFNLTDQAFIDTYRLTKDLARSLIEEIKPVMPECTKSIEFSVEAKVLATLSFFANGKYQKTIAGKSDPSITQYFVSTAVIQVSEAMNHSSIVKKYIHFPHLRSERDAIKTSIAISLRLGINLTQPHCCPCGAQVDRLGHHGLSCQRSAGRLSRHAALNVVIQRALVTANVPTQLEPNGILRDDGKMPDGMTLIPWKNGRWLIWDANCVDTMEPSHLKVSSKVAGMVATDAEIHKLQKYASITQNYIFLPLGVETMGPWGSEAKLFLNIFGNGWLTPQVTQRAGTYLGQRISLAIQRGNVASVLETHPTDSNLFYMKYGMPNVVGCIDCTHVPIMRPEEDQKRYYNKSYHSKKAQIICDSDLNIMSVEATPGGCSSHDAVLSSHAVRIDLESLNRARELCWLVGSAFYIQRPYLMTPLPKITKKSPMSKEKYYTNLHSQTHAAVTETIKHLKSRWKCLQATCNRQFDAATVSKIIVACCILHNICNRNLLPPIQMTATEERLEDMKQRVANGPVSRKQEVDADGIQARNMLIETLWNDRRVTPECSSAPKRRMSKKDRILEAHQPQLQTLMPAVPPHPMHEDPKRPRLVMNSNPYGLGVAPGWGHYPQH